MNNNVNLFMNLVQPVEKPTETPSVNISFDGLIKPVDPIKNESLGLDMSSLIEKNTDKEENPNNGVDIKMDRIISDESTPDHRFNFQLQECGDGSDEIHPVSENEFEQIAKSIIGKYTSQSNKEEKFVTKKFSSWISRIIERKGEDYVKNYLSVDEVSNNARTIIDDMINGRIDYTEYGQYIIMPTILETLISYCSNKISILVPVYNCIGYTYNDFQNMQNIADPNRINALSFIDDNNSRNISHAINIYQQDISIYTIILEKLKYVQATNNAMSLFNIASELKSVGKIKKRRY